MGTRLTKLLCEVWGHVSLCEGYHPDLPTDYLVLVLRQYLPTDSSQQLDVAIRNISRPTTFHHRSSSRILLPERLLWWFHQIVAWTICFTCVDPGEMEVCLLCLHRMCQISSSWNFPLSQLPGSCNFDAECSKEGWQDTIICIGKFFFLKKKKKKEEKKDSLHVTSLRRSTTPLRHTCHQK